MRHTLHQRVVVSCGVLQSYMQSVAAMHRVVSKIGWCTIHARHSPSVLQGPVAVCGSELRSVAAIYAVSCSYI